MHTSLLRTAAVLICLATGTLALGQNSTAPAPDKSKAEPPVSTADEDLGLALETSFDYTSGKYGTTDKTLNYTWNAVITDTYRNWTTTLTIPYQRVKAPLGVSLVNGKPRLTASDLANGKLATVANLYGMTAAQLREAVASANKLTVAQFTALKAAKRVLLVNAYLASLAAMSGYTTNAGLGDVDLSIGYDLYNDKNTGWDLSLNGGVTFGTASVSKGLGTGKMSFATGLDLSRTLGKFTPDLSVGYKFIGKPTGSDLKNYCTGSLGCSYDITDDISINASYSINGPSSSGVSSDQEITVGYRQHFGKSMSFELHGIAGLTSAAPDFGFGGAIQCSF